MTVMGTGKYVIEKTIRSTDDIKKVTLRLMRSGSECSNLTVTVKGGRLVFSCTPLFTPLFGADKSNDPLILGTFFKNPKRVYFDEIRQNWGGIVGMDYYEGKSVEEWVYVKSDKSFFGRVLRGTNEDCGKYSLQISNRKFLYAQFFKNRHVSDCILVDGNYQRCAEMWGVTDSGRRTTYNEWVVYYPIGDIYGVTDMMYILAFKEGMNLLKKMYASSYMPKGIKVREEYTTIDDYAFIKNHYDMSDIDKLQTILKSMLKSYRDSMR